MTGAPGMPSAAEIIADVTEKKDMEIKALIEKSTVRSAAPAKILIEVFVNTNFMKKRDFPMDM